MPKRNKQTGTPSRKSITGKLSRKVGKRIMHPWGGPNIPQRSSRGRTVSGGSSSRQSRPDASLSPQTKGYPKNQPSQWPVEPDYVNHTLSPSTSGLNNTTAASHNAAVENAYKRAGYQ